MKSIGERIRERREECGISREALAEMIDASAEMVACWERDETASLRLEQLMGLAERLERSVEWLVCGDAWTDGGDAEAEVVEFVRLVGGLNPEIRDSLRRFMEVMVRP